MELFISVLQLLHVTATHVKMEEPAQKKEMTATFVSVQRGSMETIARKVIL